MNYNPDSMQYSNDFMSFDPETGRFVLTEKAINERCGINIRARLSVDKTIIPEVVINKLCRTASDMIYNYIHSFSVHNRRQDELIVARQELRRAVESAMEYQIEFLLANGDLYMSTEQKDIGNEIHRMSKEVLLNSGILYCGV